MAKEVQLANSGSSGLTNGSLKKRARHQTKQVNGDGGKQLSSMSAEEQFNAAVNVIQNLPKNGSFQPSDQMKLKFYALFKQAKEGPNTTPKPSFYEIVARYKWEAWTKLGQMPREEAMKNYVNELKQIVETMPYNDSIEKFYDELGPFFEFQKKESSGRRVNGTRLNGGSTLHTRDADYSSPSDSSSESDDFSDTVDSLSINGDHSRSNDSHENNRNHFEDCTDENAKLQPGDLINAKGMDADYLTGQENYFYDCIDKNAVLNPNDIICARGETGIFSSRTTLPSGQEQTGSRASFRQPLSIDNSGFRSQGAGQQGTGSGAGDGGEDRNYSTQHSELSDIHEHLALTVLRLQQTVKSISNRIESLEAKVNERQVEQSKKTIKKQAWWSNRTTQTTVLLILWPFAAHLIISAIKKKVQINK